MAKRSFTIVSKEVNGRRISASRIACNACGNEGLAYDAAGRAKPNSAAQQYFEREGWVVGRTGRLDRCPQCRPSAISKPAEPILLEAEEVMADVPREMSRDDRRIIFAKLDDVYIGEDKGYSAGWSDQKVADDLGIPRAWVERMREENFGDLRSNEATELGAQVIRLDQKMVDVLRRIDDARAIVRETTAEMKPIVDELARLSKKIHDVCK